MSDRKSPFVAAGKLLVGCWILMAGFFAFALYKGAGENRTILPSLRIDPNTAPWWELTVIPDVGPSLARNIVDYRERRRAVSAANETKVFQSIKDLDAVKGIGPKTLTRIEPHLHFDGASTVAKPPGPASDEGNTK